MGMPKLWGKDKDGNRGFLFSHVKTIYYNWASKILLSTKLDEMDALIDAKIAKAMMSNQQVNSTDKVPTSALAYAMSQNIAKNTTDITAINGSLDNTTFTTNTSSGKKLKQINLFVDSLLYRLQIHLDNEGMSLYDKDWGKIWQAATKSDLDTKMAYTVGVADLNNAPYGNMIFVSTANAKNIPSGLNSNACMVFQNVAGERYRVQIAFSVASDKIAIRRMFNATTWQDDWKYFTAT